MSAPNFRVSPDAAAQLVHADAWWRENRPLTPDAVLEDVYDVIDVLRDAPDIGAPYPHETLHDLRRMLARRVGLHVYTSSGMGSSW